MVSPFSAAPTGNHTVASLADVAVSPVLTRETSMVSADGITRRAGSTASSASVFWFLSPASSTRPVGNHALKGQCMSGSRPRPQARPRSHGKLHTARDALARNPPRACMLARGKTAAGASDQDKGFLGPWCSTPTHSRSHEHSTDAFGFATEWIADMSPVNDGQRPRAGLKGGREAWGVTNGSVCLGFSWSEPRRCLRASPPWAHESPRCSRRVEPSSIIIGMVRFNQGLSFTL